jgi:hypothetical protein
VNEEWARLFADNSDETEELSGAIALKLNFKVEKN